MKRKTVNLLASAFFSVMMILNFSGCYSIFSGGTGGLVVDSESTANPKAGIANVDVYAYVDAADRNKDFSNWKEGTTFAPKVEYYGHTTTARDGSFRINKLVWKSASPEFGKDGDYRKVYLLFYHENYGLTKGETVVISDSSSDTIYAELTAVKKSTTLNLNFVDVGTNVNTNHSLYVEVAVPQATEKNPDAKEKVYKGTITGSGTMIISYPRWLNASDKADEIENTPDVTISYIQNSDEITWKGCNNSDNDYSFCDEDNKTTVEKTIRNSNYTVNLYGKATKLSIPSVNGQYNSAGGTASDGVVITMKKSDGTVEFGQVTTNAQTLGTSGTEKHGVFSGLGNGYTWTDTAYTGKYATIEVKLYADGTEKKTLTLRSDERNRTVQL